MKTTKKPRGSFFSDMAYLQTFTRGQDALVIVYAAFLIVVGIVMNFLSCIAVPMIVYQAETAASPAPLLSTIAAVTVLLFLLHFLWNYTDGIFSQRLDRLRTRGNTALAEHALAMPYAQSINAGVQRLLRRATQAFGTHIGAPIPRCWKALSMLFIHAAGVLICALILGSGHMWLLCITAALTVLRAVAHSAVTAWDHRRKEEEKTLDEQLARVPRAVASFRFAADIAVFGLRPWLNAIHDSGMRAMNAFLQRRATAYFLFTLADALLTLLSNGAAYAALAAATIYEGTSPSAFLLYAAVVGGFTQSLSWSIDDAQTLCEQLPFVRAVRDFLSREIPCRAETPDMPTVKTPPALSVQDVSFTDPVSGVPVLSHLSLSIDSGETVAIVGEDDKAITALAQLLCGLCEPDAGSVCCDDIAAQSFDCAARFSATLFEGAFVDATVAQIVGGMDGVDRVRVWDCLDKADLSKTICALSGGIDTVIGKAAFDDGVCLSVADEARLRLARALYRDGDVVLFDEASFSLDPIAERTLCEAYLRLAHDKTAVFLSRRLLTARHCDRIVVIKNGAVVESGTHEELLACGGEYARVYAAQSHRYREGGDDA